MSQTSYRTEQMRAYRFLKEYLSGWHIELEYYPKNLKPFKDVYPKKDWSIDILCYSDQGDKIAVELDGQSHDKANRYRKDENKDLVLAWNGYRVVRLNYQDCPKLWSEQDGFQEEIIHALSRK